MKYLKKYTWHQMMLHLVSLRLGNNISFDWIDQTYYTLCDIGICKPIDGYVPDKSWLSRKEESELERWKKIHCTEYSTKGE